MPDPKSIADHMDDRICCRVEAGDCPSGPEGVSEVLVAELDAIGVGGRSVLDVGCGMGALCLELLGRGATTAVGIDLSTQAITAARDAAERGGFGDRARFLIGDGSEAVLEQADVVVLDKVYCCYFDPTALREHTLPAAGRVYAIVLPPSRGLRGIVARLVIGAENLWRRVQRDPFRAYVHDVPAIEADIVADGFRRASLRRRLLWDVRVYVREGA